MRAHYSLTGRVRPLLFWMGKDGVGEARIAWIAGENGEQGYELLVGSDPARAPRKVNRWGYITERRDADGVHVLGFMTEVDEETLEQARAGAERTPSGSRAFKIIQGTVLRDQASASVTGVMLPDDLTYRDAEAVKRQLPPGSTPRSRLDVPPGAEPGFLFAMASLIHENVEGYMSTRRTSTEGRRSYVYGDKIYDLAIHSSRLLARTTIKGREYSNVIDTEFRTRSRSGSGGSKYRVVYGTEGPLREVPLRIVYRPKWWFEAEMVLTDVQQEVLGPESSVIRPHN